MNIHHEFSIFRRKKKEPGSMCRYIYLFLLGSWWAGKSDDDGLTQIATRADDDDDDDAPSEMITSK